MKNFFKTFGAALLAFFAGTILMGLILMLMFAGLTSTFSKNPISVLPESVLTIDLESGIVDSPGNSIGNVDFNTFDIAHPNTTLQISTALELAATDPNIKGICINLTGKGAVNYGNIEELRADLLKFKESGKFIVAYNDVYTQGAYWLCSVADKVFVNPKGYMEWRGVAANVMFFKGLLDKLDADVEVIRHGTFKAAVEPFIMDKMSPENRIQMNTIVGSLWNVMLSDVSASRGIEVAKLNEYAETMAISEPSDALALGMVDGLLYSDQMTGVLSSMVKGETPSDYTAVKDDNNVHTVSLGDYIAVHGMNKKVSKNKIALIYAEGEIVDGESSKGSVGGVTLAGQIAQARKDKGVKAVVLRVNSPGGSALASEVIWREMELCRQQKPVIVSMGGVAASGGYYISAPADVIIADRMTQTGSIGVFGMLLNLEKTMNNKLGITVDVAKTNPSADMGSIARPLSPAERVYMQRQVDGTYKTFVDRVATGRNMSTEKVDSIGQGRVWLGVDAEKIGLIDGFGGLSNAIMLAVDRAGVAEDFRIYEITEGQSSFAALMSMLSAKLKISAPIAVPSEFEDAVKQYEAVNRIIGEKGVLARMPYNIDFE